MVYFSLTDSMYGASIWGIIMGMAIMMMYLPLIQYREVVFTLIFPVMLSLLSHNKHFFVSLPVIIVAALMAFVYTLLLRTNKNVRKAQGKPLEKKVESAAIYASTALCFMMSIIVVGNFIPIYDYKSNATALFN